MLENWDDKDLAIIALTVIAIVCILTWKFSTAVAVVSNIVTTIAGVVTGRALKTEQPPVEVDISPEDIHHR